MLTKTALTPELKYLSLNQKSGPNSKLDAKYQQVNGFLFMTTKQLPMLPSLMLII